jgi:hypothetical protein
MALSLAEQYANAELFRESSRFVLDQREWIGRRYRAKSIASWDQEEMDGLSELTQLNLSKR